MWLLLFSQWPSTRKEGTFEVFQNEETAMDKSAINPMFEKGEPDNVYEDVDEVIGETE